MEIESPTDFEKFKFVFEALKDVSNMYGQFSFTATASILLVIGWILTSDDLRAFIGNEPNLKAAFAVVVASIFAVEIYLSYVLYKDSADLYNHIKTIDSGITERAYEYKRTDSSTIWLFLTVHLLMYLFLIYLVWIISPVKPVAL